jgi:hypothetical protein
MAGQMGERAPGPGPPGPGNPAAHGKRWTMAVSEQHVRELRLEYPGLEFRLGRGWDGPVIETWRERAPGGGFYAMIGDDPDELRKELDAAGCRLAWSAGPGPCQEARPGG